MAMALDQLMGEGGTKLAVSNRCQWNWKKTDVFVELDRLMKDDHLVFSMILSFRIKKKVFLLQDCPLCSSPLDLMVKMSWIGRTGWKGVKIFYNVSDSFKTGFALSPGAKTIKLRTALGSCSNMTVFIFDVSQAKTTYQGASFKNHKSLWLPCFVRYVTTETGESWTSINPSFEYTDLMSGNI